MSDRKSREDDSLELPLIERRAVPRAPFPGITATVLGQGPLANKSFTLKEIGLESVFFETPEDEPDLFEIGEKYRIRLTFKDQIADCSVECLRSEEQHRRGVVMRIIPPAKEAQNLIDSILQPAKVPHGPH